MVIIRVLGSSVVPFCPFSFWAPLLKPNSSPIILGLLWNLAFERMDLLVPLRVFFKRLGC